MPAKATDKLEKVYYFQLLSKLVPCSNAPQLRRRSSLLLPSVRRCYRRLLILMWLHGMPSEDRGERLQIMLNQDELRALENWRFEKRMPSRAAAVRELLRRGLAAEGFDLAGEGVQSKQFGIVDKGGADASSDEDA